MNFLAAFLTLTLFSLPVCWGAGTAGETVKFQTTDGKTLVGLFAPAKPGNPTVIMLHGLAASKEEWSPLFDALKAHGWGAFSYDARGHGQSSLSKSPEGYPDGYKYFGPPGPGSEWEKMIDDVGSAERYLAAQKKVDRQNIFLAGASVGANVALNYAVLARPPKGLILLSPGLSYQGFLSEGPIQKARFPVLIVASEADPYAFSSSRKLAGLNPKVTFWSDVKPGHGVQMFDAYLLPRIFNWLKSKSSPK